MAPHAQGSSAVPHLLSTRVVQCALAHGPKGGGSKSMQRQAFDGVPLARMAHLKHQQPVPRCGRCRSCVWRARANTGGTRVCGCGTGGGNRQSPCRQIALQTAAFKLNQPTASGNHFAHHRSCIIDIDRLRWAGARLVPIITSIMYPCIRKARSGCEMRNPSAVWWNRWDRPCSQAFTH